MEIGSYIVNLVIRALLLIILITLTFIASAAPPKFVYRYDTRPPSEIFKYGFTSLGAGDGNDDPLKYIVGGEILENSRFISTSESPGAIIHTYTALQISRGLRDVYLYRIRATSNVYSMVDYLNNLRQNGFITGDARVPLATSLLNRYEYQREWFAVDRIDATQVAGVQILVNHGDGNVTVGPEQLNVNYVDRDTHASAYPYPLVGAPVPESIAFMRTDVGPTPSGMLMGPPAPPSRGILSSLFSCLPSGASTSGRASSYNDELGCTADITITLGHYYGLIDNAYDIL